MVPPRSRQGAASAELDSSPPSSSLKRKRSHRHPSPNRTAKQHQQQPTIHSLFPSQSKSQSNLSAAGSPDSRHCADYINSSPPPPSSSAATPSRRLAKRDMYKFESRSPVAHGKTSIDLTNSSPPASPQVRRLNGSIKSRPGLNPNLGAKKLVVKNLKTNVAWDGKAYLEKIWGQLDEALTVIFNDKHITFSKEDLYHGVENVCRQGGASTLFSRLDARCKKHMEDEVRGPLLANLNANRRTTLKAVLAEWARWKAQMVTIRAVFFFLDRSYLLSSSKPTLVQFTPQLFRDIVFNHGKLKDAIIDGTCDLVAEERKSSDSIDRMTFQQAVDMFHELAVYTASFEPRYLGSTQQYITKLSDDMIVEKTVPDYVASAQKCIDDEMSRCEDFALDTSTRRDLLTLLEEHLIATKQADLSDHEALAAMLDRNATSELTALYALLDRRRLGDSLRPAFEKWVDETGTAIVFGQQEDTMVIHLLSLKRRLDHIWRSAFLRNETIGHALRETFETFMNKTKKGDATWGTDNTKVGEMIAKYVDLLLRGGVKAIPEVLTARRSSSITGPIPSASELTSAAQDDENNNDDDEMDEDEEINIQLDQVLDLFRFVHGKAVFEAFYKRDLARRLLMGRSASADAERSMLTRLKTECGSGFTQNLEQMFKDVELAREEMQSYKRRIEDRASFEKGKTIDLNVNILSAAAWPTYPDIPVVIPANVKRAIDDFEMHYKSKHSGRKLDWKHALAHCQMRATFAKSSKELVVSSFQAVVLLLFNGLEDGAHLTYKHILSQTGLPEPEVKRTLQSLACAKLRPLTKHPKGKEINPTDTFTVNLDFTHPKYRVKVNQVQLKETKEENKETHMRVAEDRNFECQAAIVRVLKSRKTISHTELVSETIKATMSRGVLAMADIKKNIDRLIEKDYMEREEGNMYSYIA